MKTMLRVLGVAALLAGCDTGAAVRAVTSDGETFTGHANQTGAWDVSGTLQLISNRGLSCVGTFVYEGLAGPRGTAKYSCNNGETGEARLMGLNAGTGEGTIGTRTINFQWGGVR